MCKIAEIIAQIITTILCVVLLTSPVGAFEWPNAIEFNNTPVSHAGQKWAVLRVEPGDTVWGYCATMLKSYNLKVTNRAQLRCENEIARVNRTSPAALNSISPGDLFVMPLNRWQNEIYIRSIVPTPPVVVNQGKYQDKVEQQLEKKVDQETFNEALSNKIDELTFNELVEKVNTIESRLHDELTQRIQTTRSLVEALEAQNNTVRMEKPTGIDQLSSIIDFFFYFWWLILLIVLLLLFIFAYVFWWNKRKSKSNKPWLQSHILQEVRANTNLSLPQGWEYVGDYPTQEALDDMPNGDTITMEFFHAVGKKNEFVFTKLAKRFEDTYGNFVNGMTSDHFDEPIAMRPHILFDACRSNLSLLPERDEHGKFVKSNP